MKHDSYIQCLLSRGNTTEIAWIPECYANRGNMLIIQDEPGWKVDAVYQKDSKNAVESRERDHLRNRKASDI